MRTALTLVVLMVASVMFVASMLGCALGAVAYKLAPEPKLPAQFNLAPVPTLILADDAMDRSLGSLDADRLGRLVEQQLVSWKIVPVIPHDRIIALRDADPTRFHRESATAIARELQAEQIVLIAFEGAELGLSMGTDMPRARAAATVRVVDLAGNVLFPIDNQTGRAVVYQTPYRKPQDRPSALGERGMAIEGLARSIARMFRPFEAGELEDRTFD